MYEMDGKSHPFFSMTGMSYIWSESLQGRSCQIKATCKVHTVRGGREEAIAKPWLDEQKPDTEAYQADELTKRNKVQKAIVTLIGKFGK